MGWQMRRERGYKIPWCIRRDGCVCVVCWLFYGKGFDRSKQWGNERRIFNFEFRFSPGQRGLLGVCFDIIDDDCQGMKQRDKTRVVPEMFSWLAKFGRELAEKSVQRMKSERDGMGGYLFVGLAARLAGERIEQMQQKREGGGGGERWIWMLYEMPASAGNPLEETRTLPGSV